MWKIFQNQNSTRIPTFTKTNEFKTALSNLIPTKFLVNLMKFLQIILYFVSLIYIVRSTAFSTEFPKNVSLQNTISSPNIHNYSLITKYTDNDQCDCQCKKLRLRKFLIEFHVPIENRTLSLEHQILGIEVLRYFFIGKQVLQGPGLQKRYHWKEFCSCFSKDGIVTEFLENIPVFGYGVSAIHALSGNQQRATRAAIRCTISNVELISIGVGSLVAGAPGACLAAHATEACAADLISNGPGVRDSRAKHRLTEYIKVAIIGTITSELGGILGVEIRKLTLLKRTSTLDPPKIPNIIPTSIAELAVRNSIILAFEDTISSEFQGNYFSPSQIQKNKEVAKHLKSEFPKTNSNNSTHDYQFVNLAKNLRLDPLTNSPNGFVIDGHEITTLPWSVIGLNDGLDFVLPNSPQTRLTIGIGKENFGNTVYVSRQGDFLNAIAVVFGLSLKEIHELNPHLNGNNFAITSNDNVVVSRNIFTSIQYQSHIVQQGDTLSAIAGRYGTTIFSLLKLNPRIQDPESIELGQQINIRKHEDYDALTFKQMSIVLEEIDCLLNVTGGFK